MIAKTALTFLAALVLPLNSAAMPYGYVEPEWYDAISASFTGINLKKCIKSNPNGPKPQPVTGQGCSATAKTCFFGTQTCNVGPYPETMCFCDGKSGTQTWTCEPEFCSVGGVVIETCPPDGEGFEFFNHPLCPKGSGFESVNTPCDAAQNGLTCQYGREDCCGTCNASLEMECDAQFGWSGFNTDACNRPSCDTEPPIDLTPIDPCDFQGANDPLCPDTWTINTPCEAAQDGLSCVYGRQDCCGQCYASTSMSCDAEFGWFGFFTDACFGPCDSTEPPIVILDPPPIIIDPVIGGPCDFEAANDPLCPEGGFEVLNTPCTAAQDGLSCQYGREDCCDQCFASLKIECNEQFGWNGFNTDACFGVFCEKPLPILTLAEDPVTRA